MKKEIAILFFIIAVLVFYIYSEKEDRTHYELPHIEEINEADISKIVLRSKGSEVVIVKDNDRWLLGEKKFPADSAAVSRMVKNITGITLTALASESENYALYDLDEDSKIEAAAFRGDHVLRKIAVGKPASSFRHTFVMVDDDPRVFHAEGNIKGDFNKNVPDLRDKKVLAFTDDIAELTLKKGDQELKILRAEPPVSANGGEGNEEDGGPKWLTADGRRVKESEVEEIISSLSNFVCDEFIEDKTRDDFTSPVFTAVLKGVRDYRISFFEKKGSQYPGVSSGSDYPFLVADWKTDRIMKDPESIVAEEKQ